jgi:hypothetical protein
MKYMKPSLREMLILSHGGADCWDGNSPGSGGCRGGSYN